MRNRGHYIMGKRIIGKNEYEVEERIMFQQEILFWTENPRVYSVLRENGNDNPYLVNVFIKVQHELHVHYFDFDLVKCFYMFSQMKVFDEGEQFQIRSNIEDLKEDETRKQLLNFFDNFKKAVIKNVIDDQAGADYIIQQVDYQLQEVYKQLSIFDL